MKKIICLLILLWPLTTLAQQVEIAPIPLEPMVHEDKYNQALEKLKETQTKLENAERTNNDLKRQLAETQKACDKAQKTARRKITSLQDEIGRLKQSTSTTTTTVPLKTTPPRSKVRYPRKSEPGTFTAEELIRIYNLDSNGRPKQYVPVTSDRFEKIKNGQVVKDIATGLMWQQAGSSNSINYQDARQYIQKLNRDHFAGYRDWRLPTVDELTSLLTKTEENGDLYIHPIFDKQQWWCWSSDQRAPAGAWLGHFRRGEVRWDSLGNFSYVRAVRSGQ